MRNHVFKFDGEEGSFVGGEEGSFVDDGTSGGDHDIWDRITRNDGDDERPFWERTDFVGDLPDVGGNWEQIDVSKEFGPEATGYTAYRDATTGKLLTITPSGQYFVDDKKIWDSGQVASSGSSGIGALINDFAKNFFTTKDASGKVTPNLAAITGLSAFLASNTGKKLLGTGEAPKVGYQGSIPKYTAVRERVSGLDDTTRRPGSGGRRYFSDTTYVDPTKAEEFKAAQTAAQTQATGLAALNKENPFYEKRPESVMPKEKEEKEKKGIAAIPRPASEVIKDTPVPKYDEKGNVVKSDYLDEPLARVTTGLGGAKASPGYFFGPADEALPDTVKTYRDYENWKSSQGVKTLPKEKPNFTTPFNPEQSLVQPMPIVGRLQPGEMEEYERMMSQQPSFGGQGPNAPTSGEEMMAIGQPVTGVSNKVAGAAQGGLMNLAKGRYLRGATDGMADKLSANIEGKQPAKLSHGEFVVPADVVSHLGNGNSEAGAKRLYDMMDKIRQARTGTTKQGKQINPNKYLPA